MRLLFILLFSSTQLFAEVTCPETIVVEGEIRRYKKDDGQVSTVIFYAALDNTVSEHAGDFRNIRIKNDLPFNRVEIWGETFKLYSIRDFKQTKDLYLIDKVLSHPTGEFEMKFLGDSIECSRKFRGYTGD